VRAASLSNVLQASKKYVNLFILKYTSDTHPPPACPPLWLITDSISSRNIVDGAWKRANSNNVWKKYTENHMTNTEKHMTKVHDKFYYLILDRYTYFKTMS